MSDLTGNLKTYINNISPVGEILLDVYIIGITIAFCLLVFFIVRSINEKPFYILFGVIIFGLVGYTTYSMFVNIFDNSPNPNSPYIVQIIPELILLFMFYNSYKKLDSNSNYRKYNNRNNS